MGIQFLHSESGLSLDHAKTFFLTLNGILIGLVGPKKIISALHRSVRPYAYLFCFIALAWTVFDTLWMSTYGVVSWTNRITFILMGLFFGLTFFAAKKNTPILYGAIEIIAGLCGLGIIGFLNLDSPILILIFGAASSVYIVVRGLANINEALIRREEAPADPGSTTNADPNELNPWEFASDPIEATQADVEYLPSAAPGGLES